MPNPFQCHWCDKPTMKIEGICIECEQKYEEGNKDIAITIRELETRVNRYEKAMKEILDCCDLKNTFILSSDDTAFACDIKDIAQASLDGEPTTADEENVVYISDVNKEIAKEWKNEEILRLAKEEEENFPVNLEDRNREEKMKSTKQDKRDIAKTMNLLDETSSYIEALIGSSNIEPHHKDMFDAIDVANEWLERIIRENENDNV